MFEQVPESTAWYHSWPLVLAATVVFPPLGLVLLWTRRGTDMQLKVLGSLAVVLLCAGYAYALFGTGRSPGAPKGTTRSLSATARRSASSRRRPEVAQATAQAADPNAAAAQASPGAETPPGSRRSPPPPARRSPPPLQPPVNPLRLPPGRRPRAATTGRTSAALRATVATKSRRSRPNWARYRPRETLEPAHRRRLRLVRRRRRHRLHHRAAARAGDGRRLPRRYGARAVDARLERRVTGTRPATARARRRRGTRGESTRSARSADCAASTPRPASPSGRKTS